MRINVAGRLFELRGIDEYPQWTHVFDTIATDSHANGDPHFTILLRRHTLNEMEALRWRLRQLGDEEVAWEDETSLRFYLGNIFLLFAWPQNRAEISVLDNAKVSTEDMFAAMNTVVSTYVIKNNGIAVHSSAVANLNGEATLLLGKPGAGKTTLTGQLSTYGSAIHDDFNLIIPAQDGYLVYPSSFAQPEVGLLKAAHNGRLHRIFYLRKSSFWRIDRIQPEEMFPLLFRGLYQVPHSAVLTNKIMEAAESICREARCSIAWFCSGTIPEPFVKELLG